MKEARISDAEMQRLVATALTKRLRAAGLHTVESCAHRWAVCLPVTLNLAGHVDVEHDDDAGEWIIRQELETALADRTTFAEGAHAGAFASREARPCR